MGIYAYGFFKYDNYNGELFEVDQRTPPEEVTFDSAREALAEAALCALGFIGWEMEVWEIGYEEHGDAESGPLGLYTIVERTFTYDGVRLVDESIKARVDAGEWVVVCTFDQERDVFVAYFCDGSDNAVRRTGRIIEGIGDTKAEATERLLRSGEAL